MTARWCVVVLVLVLALFACAGPNTQIENHIPEALAAATQPGSNFDASGFPEGEGRALVVANCTACHSDKLVRQNRSTKEGWRELIRWMQKKQGLWPLDLQTEDTILEYLASHYGRPALADDTRRPALPDHLLPPGSP